MRDGLVNDDSVLYRELTTIGVFTEKHVIWLVGRGHRQNRKMLSIEYTSKLYIKIIKNIFFTLLIII